MFCLVYEFKVKNGRNEDFEKSWAGYTDSIHRICVAYAQWALKEMTEQGMGSRCLHPRRAPAITDLLRDAVESSEIVYEIEVLDDRLRRLALVKYEPDDFDYDDDDDEDEDEDDNEDVDV